MVVPLSAIEFCDRAEALHARRIGVLDGDRQFSYAQFAERRAKQANALRSLG